MVCVFSSVFLTLEFSCKVLYFRNTNVICLNILLAISGKTPPPFPACDWRFNEFPNPVAHALHVTWVELMALPVTGQEAGDALFDVIFKGSYVTNNTNIRANIVEWINAVGLVLSSLPVNIDFLNTAVKPKVTSGFHLQELLYKFEAYCAGHKVNYRR